MENLKHFFECNSLCLINNIKCHEIKTANYAEHSSYFIRMWFNWTRFAFSSEPLIDVSLTCPWFIGLSQQCLCVCFIIIIHSSNWNWKLYQWLLVEIKDQLQVDEIDDDKQNFGNSKALLCYTQTANITFSHFPGMLKVII